LPWEINASFSMVAHCLGVLAVCPFVFTEISAEKLFQRN